MKLPHLTTGHLFATFLLLLGLLPTVSQAAEDGAARLSVHPAQLLLSGQASQQQLVVMATVNEEQQDVTRTAEFRVEDPSIATVDDAGIVRPLADGSTRVIAHWQNAMAASEVTVKDGQLLGPVSFELEVQPILAANGCSVGACHGKARGQNGFQLSLLGFDSEFDYLALTRHARGRRVFPASPELSLLLQKPTGEVPHGGGVRLAAGSRDYHTIHRWIDAGTPRSVEGEPQLQRVEIFPTHRLMKPAEQQQLIVTAFYSDGSSRDVTGQTTFQSNESAIVAVDSSGRVTAGPLPGESTLMARFMGQITICGVLIPLQGEVPAEHYAQLPRNNFIDELVWQKLELLRIEAAGEADDGRFMRRASIDIIGRFPTSDEVRAFLLDPADDKRQRYITSLLSRPEYADHWANKWTDLLRPNPYRVGIKAVLNYDNWIRQSFRDNKPYDQFVRELVTAEGSTWRNGAATMFRDRRSPDELTTIVSRLFLGIRLECAKCHHHPFERWSQEDFFSFAAYFSEVGRKGSGLSPPISGGEEVIMTKTGGTVSHPLTGEVLPPRPLYGDIEPGQEETQRDTLARWMTSPQNDYFAKVMVNRVWAEMMGRGLVVPVDDIRATNPATNEPLLTALAEYFRDSGFDLKALVAVIANSHVYALSSTPNDRNVADTRNYSRHYRQRLRAEVLVDAVTDVTGVQESFSGMVSGSRANQIWTHRVTSLFLDTFGRPDPNQDPPCDRTGESTVTQALHMMNAPNIHSKIKSDDGSPARWAASEMTPPQIVEEIYLSCYARFPTESEGQACLAVFAEKDMTRRRAAEDILWALVNTPEFIIKD